MLNKVLKKKKVFAVEMSKIGERSQKLDSMNTLLKFEF